MSLRRLKAFQDAEFQWPLHSLLEKCHIVLMDPIENPTFSALLSRIKQCQDYPQRLWGHLANHQVQLYRIEELTPDNVEQLYGCLCKKFYLKRTSRPEEYWYENQLRIFVWLLMGHLHVEHRAIQTLGEDDWTMFSRIFNHKPPVFFQFQSRMLMKAQGRTARWTEEETQILLAVIKQKGSKHKWNLMARQLFILSGGRYFRSAKQCRQRWMNHLDPCKVHSGWTAAEDLTMLQCIRQNGKRWSLAVKCLQNTRTEHMVKNRYKSLMAMETKKHRNKSQDEAEFQLIKRLKKSLGKPRKQSQPKIQEQQVELKQETADEKMAKLERRKGSMEFPLGFFDKQDDGEAQNLLGDCMVGHNSPLQLWGGNSEEEHSKSRQDGFEDDSNRQMEEEPCFNY